MTKHVPSLFSFFSLLLYLSLGSLPAAFASTPLEVLHKNATLSIREGDLSSLERILSTEADDLNRAILAGDSLLHEALVDSFCPEAYRLLAQYGVELGDAVSFRRHFYTWEYPLSLEENFTVHVAEELVTLGFVRPEDLLPIAVGVRSVDLWSWLKNKSTDFSHPIPVDDAGNTLTLAQYCLRECPDSLSGLLLAGVIDPNTSPAPGFKNLWHLMPNFLVSKELVSFVAAFTDDLFTPFENIDDDDSDVFCSHLDKALSQELILRLQPGSHRPINLSTFDSVDSWGRTLLDRVSLFRPCTMSRSAKVLRNGALLPSNFPLSDAIACREMDVMNELLDAGQGLLLDEQPYPGADALKLLVNKGWGWLESDKKLTYQGRPLTLPRASKPYHSLSFYMCREEPIHRQLLVWLAEKCTREELQEWICIFGRLGQGKKNHESVMEVVKEVLESELNE